MARISGVDIPREKRLEIALTYIYGIGPSTAQRILTNAGVSYDVKVSEWNDDQLNKIRSIISHRLPFQRIMEGLEIAATPQSAKVMIEFDA